MKFSELAASLKEGLSPVYVAEGEETYFTEHTVTGIRAACGLTQPTLNDTREEGEALKGEKLSAFVATLYTLPFFDERRLIRVYEFHPTEREWESTLKNYVENPCASTVLVIVNAQKKPNTVDFSKKKGIVYVDCSRAHEETLTRWLFGLMRRSDLNADTDAVSRIVRYCACNAARMKLETEKLRLLLGEGGRVTREVVDELVERDVEYKLYEMTQASSRGDFTRFTEIVSDLEKKGYDETAILLALAGHYRQLMEIGELASLPEAEVAKKIGIKPYAVRKSREGIKMLGVDRVRARFFALSELSYSLRSGNCSKSGALMQAIVKIFFE